MTANERLEAIRVIEHHLTMNRQERRQAGISTPRRIIEAARDELIEASWTEHRDQQQPNPYLPAHMMSTTEALPRQLLPIERETPAQWRALHGGRFGG